MQKKLLIIEDLEIWQKQYKLALKKYSDITVIHAFTLKEGRDLFFQTPKTELAAIVFDGCLSKGDTLDSLPLIKEIRELYEGIMIAASSYEHYREKMMEAGCNYKSEKIGVPALIQKLLYPDVDTEKACA